MSDGEGLGGGTVFNGLLTGGKFFHALRSFLAYGSVPFIIGGVFSICNICGEI